MTLIGRLASMVSSAAAAVGTLAALLALLLSGSLLPQIEPAGVVGLGASAGFMFAVGVRSFARPTSAASLLLATIVGFFWFAAASVFAEPPTTRAFGATRDAVFATTALVAQLVATLSFLVAGVVGMARR